MSEIKSNGFELPSIKKYLRENVLSISIIAVCVLITYGIEMFSKSISFDTNIMISNPGYIYDQWYQLGRFGLIPSKMLFCTHWFNRGSATILTAVAQLIFGITWSYLFYASKSDSAKKNTFGWVFPVVFLSSPILAEQLGFELQSFEVMLGMIFCGLSLIFLLKAIMQNRYWFYAFGIFMAFLSFGIYQSLVPLFIAGACACFILLWDRYSARRDEFEYKTPFFWTIVLKFAGSFAVAFALYNIANRILVKTLNIGQISYLEDKIRWRKEPIDTCLHNIYVSVKDIVFGTDIISQPIYLNRALAVLIPVFIIIIAIQIRKKHKDFYLMALASILLLMSPFLMNIYLGNQADVRSLIGVPFLAAFLADYILSRTPQKLKYARVAVTVFALYLALSQSQISARLYYTADVAYEQAVAVATQVSDRIGRLDIPNAEQGIEVATIGACKVPGNNDTYGDDEVDVMPRTPISIAHSSYQGTQVFQYFMDNLGYNYLAPSPEEIILAEQESKDMPVWPASGSVQYRNGVVIVKFEDRTS